MLCAKPPIWTPFLSVRIVLTGSVPKLIAEMLNTLASLGCIEWLTHSYPWGQIQVRAERPVVQVYFVALVDQRTLGSGKRRGLASTFNEVLADPGGGINSSKHLRQLLNGLFRKIA